MDNQLFFVQSRYRSNTAKFRLVNTTEVAGEMTISANQIITVPSVVGIHNGFISNAHLYVLRMASRMGYIKISKFTLCLIKHTKQRIGLNIRRCANDRTV